MASPSHQGKFDLRIICDALGGIATKWFKIGIQLGIPHNKLLEFQGSPDPLSAVIDYWLRNVAGSSSLKSWQSIVTMLKSKHVGEPGLAEDINKDYCLQEGVPPSKRARIDDQAEAASESYLSNQPAADVENDGQKKEQATHHSLSTQPSPPTQQDKSDHQKKEKATHHTLSTEPSPPTQQDKSDQDVKEELKRILHRNLRDITAKYAEYTDCLRVAVEEKNVPARALQSYLLSLPATSHNNEGQTLALLSDKEAELKDCSNIVDIFDFIKTKCASFLDYDIFQCIQKRYGICPDKEAFRYPDYLKAYIEKHKISEFAKINPLLKPKNGSKNLILKYDIETTCRLAKLTDLKILIADIMEISSLALEIVDIKEGCTIVTIFIPASVADALFTPDTVFTSQQVERLQAASVLWMKCNGSTYYFDKRSNKKRGDC